MLPGQTRYSVVTGAAVILGLPLDAGRHPILILALSCGFRVPRNT